MSNTNGKLTLVDKIVEPLEVRLQSYTMEENFYIYLLKGHSHIIMGVQWLFELGDIHTNYQKLTISFEIDGRTRTLQEIRDECPQVDNKRMEVLEWCQEKEEDEGEVQFDKQHHTEFLHPMLDAWEVLHTTLDSWAGPHLTLEP